jgi:hypothetical protein
MYPTEVLFVPVPENAENPHDVLAVSNIETPDATSPQ